jgi:peroxiredoxin
LGAKEDAVPQRTRNRLDPGAEVAPRKLTDIDDRPVPIPDPDQLVHLQFRRFAGCPVCHLHLRSFSARHDELEAAGVREVAVFHATADALRAQPGETWPFPLIADPGKELYREFGVESSPLAVLHPKAWATELRGMWDRRRALHRLNVRGGIIGLPADFLIDSDGRIVASHYGAHADDQWSVDQVLQLAVR